MIRPSVLPDDPAARFRALYDLLNAERSWFDGPQSLRFAAVAALTCPGEPREVATAIRDVAEQLKQGTSWWTDLRVPLGGPLRFVVSAMLVAAGDDPEAFRREVERVRKMFRAVRLSRGEVFETIAILVLRLGKRGAPVDRDDVARLRAIHDEMRRYHWWLTGPDDFPACALLVGLPGAPTAIGSATEATYQAVRARGFARGNPLQTAANLLQLSGLPAAEAAARFRALADGFRKAQVAIWQCDYEELAILAFLAQPVDQVVARTLHYRTLMGDLRPKPDRVTTFNLGASLAFLELVRLDARGRPITEARALRDLQAVLTAHNVATAATAATAAADAND